MKSGFALLVCAGVLALGTPMPALAQRTISLGGSGPQEEFPTSVKPSGPRVPAVDPATLKGLPAARDYQAPQGVGFKAADFISENVRLTAQWFWAAGDDGGGDGRKLPTVILAPGWGATAASAREDAVELARAGYLVMLFDYRGWGDSDGRTGGQPAHELRGYIDPWEQAEDWFNAVS
ncbi:MAG: serine aminopeptidase domain-containing protein, partial [Phenylobacterium sp.]